MSTINEPRSSRLKDKKRGEGEMMVKELFVQNVIENNDLLHILLKEGSSCVLLPYDSLDIPLFSNSRIGSQIMVKPRSSLGLCSSEEALEPSGNLPGEDAILDGNVPMRFGHLNGLCQGKRIPSVKYGRYASNFLYASTSDSQKMENEKDSTSQVEGLLEQGLFSCVTCGILSFACVAVVQPTEAAASFLMSPDCNLLDDHTVGLGATDDQLCNVAETSTDNSDLDAHLGRMEKNDKCSLYDIPIQSAAYTIQALNRRVEPTSNTMAQGVTSLDLLAHAYGDSSDSEDEAIQHPKMSISSDENSNMSSFRRDDQTKAAGVLSHPSSILGIGYEASTQLSIVNDRCPKPSDYFLGNVVENEASAKPWGLDDVNRNQMTKLGSITTSRGNTDFAGVGSKESDGWLPCIGTSQFPWLDAKMGDTESCISNSAVKGKFIETTKFADTDSSSKSPNISFIQRSDRDSSRMHIFCLEHAVEVEKQLRSIGGLHMLLLCHPDYPKVESQAKSLAEELGVNYCWKDVHFRDATDDDKEKIRLALDDEEVIPGNGDWAVKLGINLYYSANLSKSPLYSKQMPYNAVLYKAFGRSSLVSSPTKPKVFVRRPGRQKKIVVAGKWCGRVWMSNQVHPYLANRDNREQESVKCYHDTDEELETDADIGEAEKSMDHERNTLSSVSTVLRKSSRKRRKQFEFEDYEKPKFPEVDNTVNIMVDSHENSSSLSKRTLRSRLKHEEIRCNDSNLKDETGGPSTRLRRRPSKPKEVKPKLKEVKMKAVSDRHRKKKVKKDSSCNDLIVKDEEAEYQCDVEGCSMGFNTKQELMLHKRNICSVKGCGKKLFSHKYLVQHRKVHMDDRPLKCPWKGCKMTFKWAWARTEHIRVHTGARPYVCCEPGCGQTFRFVSDFSRHKRKTGHSVKKGRT